MDVIPEAKHDTVVAGSDTSVSHLPTPWVFHLIGVPPVLRFPCGKRDSRILWKGIHYLIERGEGDWVIDEIVFAQAFRPHVRCEEFQVWTLQPLQSGAAWLTCEDGQSNRVDRQRIPHTSFDIPGLKIWYVKGTIMLPREY